MDEFSEQTEDLFEQIEAFKNEDLSTWRNAKELLCCWYHPDFGCLPTSPRSAIILHEDLTDTIIDKFSVGIGICDLKMVLLEYYLMQQVAGQAQLQLFQAIDQMLHREERV